ncbi:MAG: histidinol dehydrogenase, partial [Chloroflexi bacterium]|nr:histidinol dehydrogenase [Chloroflexota bacterium]
LREELNDIEEERRSALQALAEMAGARVALEARLAAHEQMNTVARLEKAEALKADIDTMTAESFESADLREFPLDSAPEVRRVATLATAARDQIKRTQAERDELAGNREKELERLGPDGAADMEELDPALEDRLAELDSRIQRLGDRVEQLDKGRDTAKARHEEAREDLDRLPDFSRLAADPVTWLTQLAGDFAGARKNRDDHRAGLAELGEAVERTQAELEEDATAVRDLLAQAEHDELATPVLITLSREHAEAVAAEVEQQLVDLDRSSIARAAIERGGAVVVGNLDEAMELANEFAPEHLCLLTENPESLVELVRNAGGVFVGEHSPEALGDYVAGPSHVMPTGGSARFASPLTVFDFLKVTTTLDVTEDEMRRIGPYAATLARAEGLTGHARSIELRLEGR